MATGHIRLGAVGALREYILDGGPERGRRRYLANPQAEKIGSGQRKYEDDTQWDYWTMSNWQAGVGKSDPEDGGFLYADLDSRVPNQLILSPALQVSSSIPQADDYTDGYYEFLSSSTYQTSVVGDSNDERIGVQFRVTDHNRDTNAVWFYAYVPYGVEVTVGLYTDSTNSPNTLVDSTTFVAYNLDKAAHWYQAAFSSANTLTVDTNYWLVVYPTDGTDITVYGGDVQNLTKTYNSAAWSGAQDPTNFTPFFITDIGRTNSSGEYWDVYHFIRGNMGLLPGTSTFFASTRNTALTKGGITIFSVANDNWATPNSFTLTFQAKAYLRMATDGSSIYLPVGENGHQVLNLGTQTWSVQSEDMHTVSSYNGFMYLSDWQDLRYAGASDPLVGITWSNAFRFPTLITGMGGMGGDLYVACEDGLYLFAAGDFVVGIAPWGSIDEENGKGMVNHGNQLFIPVNGRMVIYNSSGSFTDIWVNRDDDLPNSKLGKVVEAASMNNWAVAVVEASEAGGSPSLWLWQQSGWHHGFTLPVGITPHSAYYDRTTEKLWVGADYGLAFSASYPDATLNPYNLTSSNYMPTGWMETGWFDGRFLEREKDFESVSIFGDNITSNTPVKVYWQDDDSTDWELLGTATANVTELRWSNYTTRPNTKRLKLGFLFSTNDPTATPKIESISVKFLANIQDRYGWTLRINVSRDAHGIDGDNLDAYTRAQQRAHLDSLEGSTPPVLLEDIDDVQYEIRVMQAHQEIKNYERRQDGTVDYDAVYVWTVEQMQDNAYA